MFTTTGIGINDPDRPSGLNEILKRMTQMRVAEVEDNMPPPEQGGQIPAIALTGFAEENVGQRATAVGFQRYFSKPVDRNQFLSALSSLVGRRNNS